MGQTGSRFSLNRWALRWPCGYEACHVPLILSLLFQTGPHSLYQKNTSTPSLQASRSICAQLVLYGMLFNSVLYRLSTVSSTPGVQSLLLLQYVQQNQIRWIIYWTVQEKIVAIDLSECYDRLTSSASADGRLFKLGNGIGGTWLRRWPVAVQLQLFTSQMWLVATRKYNSSKSDVQFQIYKGLWL